MFKTIVVGSDGSDNADVAVRAAAALASEKGAKLHLVMAARPLTPQQISEMRAVLPKEFWPVLNADYFTEGKIDHSVALCRAEGVEPESHVLESSAADAIIDVAAAAGADLVVVGSRGESAPKRAIHGSVSTKVLHHAPCSVLVVRHDPDTLGLAR